MSKNVKNDNVTDDSKRSLDMSDRPLAHVTNQNTHTNTQSYNNRYRKPSCTDSNHSTQSYHRNRTRPYADPIRKREPYPRYPQDTHLSKTYYGSYRNRKNDRFGGDYHERTHVDPNRHKDRSSSGSHKSPSYQPTYTRNQHHLMRDTPHYGEKKYDDPKSLRRTRNQSPRTPHVRNDYPSSSSSPQTPQPSSSSSSHKETMKNIIKIENDGCRYDPLDHRDRTYSPRSVCTQDESRQKDQTSSQYYTKRRGNVDYGTPEHRSQNMMVDDTYHRVKNTQHVRNSSPLQYNHKGYDRDDIRVNNLQKNQSITPHQSNTLSRKMEHLKDDKKQHSHLPHQKNNVILTDAQKFKRMVDHMYQSLNTDKSFYSLCKRWYDDYLYNHSPHYRQKKAHQKNNVSTSMPMVEEISIPSQATDVIFDSQHFDVSDVSEKSPKYESCDVSTARSISSSPEFKPKSIPILRDRVQQNNETLDHNNVYNNTQDTDHHDVDHNSILNISQTSEMQSRHDFNVSSSEAFENMMDTVFNEQCLREEMTSHVLTPPRQENSMDGAKDERKVTNAEHEMDSQQKMLEVLSETSSSIPSNFQDSQSELSQQSHQSYSTPAPFISHSDHTTNNSSIIVQDQHTRSVDIDDFIKIADDESENDLSAQSSKKQMVTISNNSSQHMHDTTSFDSQANSNTSLDGVYHDSVNKNVQNNDGIHDFNQEWDAELAYISNIEEIDGLNANNYHAYELKTPKNAEQQGHQNILLREHDNISTQSSLDLDKYSLAKNTKDRHAHLSQPLRPETLTQQTNIDYRPINLKKERLKRTEKNTHMTKKTTLNNKKRKTYPSLKIMEPTSSDVLHDEINMSENVTHLSMPQKSCDLVDEKQKSAGKKQPRTKSCKKKSNTIDADASKPNDARVKKTNKRQKNISVDNAFSMCTSSESSTKRIHVSSNDQDDHNANIQDSTLSVVKSGMDEDKKLSLQNIFNKYKTKKRYKPDAKENQIMLAYWQENHTDVCYDMFISKIISNEIDII